MQAVILCAETNVLRGFVPLKPPNRPNLPAEVGIAVAPPGSPSSHGGHK